jgi:hypothetical protein
MAEQAKVVRAALMALGGPASAAQVSAAFTAAPPERVAELLETPGASWVGARWRMSGTRRGSERQGVSMCSKVPAETPHSLKVHIQEEVR